MLKFLTSFSLTLIFFGFAFWMVGRRILNDITTPKPLVIYNVTQTNSTPEKDPSDNPEAFGYRIATDGKTYRIECNWMGFWAKAIFGQNEFKTLEEAERRIRQLRAEAPEWEKRHKQNEAFKPVYPML